MSEKTLTTKEEFKDPEGLIREETQSGIYIKPVFNPDDLKDKDYARDIGDPGAYPYTRGIYPEMFRNRLWLKSFLVSYDTPENTNAAFRSYIAQGLNDLRITSDLASQTGIDPTHPLADSSMFFGGINAYAIGPYERVCEGLPIEKTVYEYGTQSVFGAFYSYCVHVAMVERRGGDIKNIFGNGIADPVRSKLVYGDPSWTTEIERRAVIDQIEFGKQFTPKWTAVVPNGVDPCQTGMNAIHELGEAIAVATAIMDDFCKRGHTIDEYGAMIFALDSESDFFESIAKFRAARRMWAKIAKERFHAEKKSCMTLKIGIRTSGISLTSQKPLNNASRVALQTLAGVLGGVNSIDACSIDEALGLPSPEARSLALDTQHIIVHEANIPLVADPLGGSYYLEWLTDKIESETNAYLKEIEDNGGIFNCLESGWLNRVQEEDRLRCQKERQEHKRLIVGVNAYKGEEGPINKAISDCAYTVPGPEAHQALVDEFKAFCAARDHEALAQTMRELYNDVKSGKNMTRAMINGIKEGMTVGEACGIVRMGYGLEYDSTGVIATPDHVAAALKDVL